MTRVECVVLGTPAPQGSKRAFVRGGRAHVVESSKAVMPWREAIVAQTRDIFADHGAIVGPVHVDATFYLRRPKSHYKSSGELRDNAPRYVTTTPDVDKVLRSTFDGLTSAGAFADDSHVASVYAQKLYVTHDNPTPCAVLVLYGDKT